MKKRILSILLALVLVIGLMPVTAMAEELPDSEQAIAIYVNAEGDDTLSGKNQESAVATLAKAAEIVNGSEGKDFIVYVMSDLTSNSLARFDGKNVTITSLNETNSADAFTVSRGDEFSSASDNARSWYHPAMVEIQTANGTASLTLTDIVFDDAGKQQGTVFAQAVSGEGNEDNLKYVQDAIIASNATQNCTITLGGGAVLRNFGGMSAVRITDQAELVIKNGGVIEDTTVTAREKGEKGSNGPAGAAWIQGSNFKMEEGAEIRNMIGRAVYVDGGTATIGGNISDVTPNKNMWQGTGGMAVHLRNQSVGVLTSTCVVDNKNIKVAGDSMICSNACNLTVNNGAVIRNAYNTKGIAVSGACTVDFDGEITGLTGTSNALNLQNGEFYVTLGRNSNIHDNQTGYGTIYIQAQNGKMDIYGKINNNIASDRGGGLAMANNFQFPTIVTMYKGAEICNNFSKQTGGGVMVSVGTFTMNGGTISGNIAEMEGGGVYVRRGGQLIMNGGTIEDNATKAIGGGISFEAGNYNNGIPCVDLNGGMISGNVMNATIETDAMTGIKSAVGGEPNDLTINSTGFGYIDRYLCISEGVTIGDKEVYFQTEGKTVASAEKSLDIKLGNAGAENISALTAESTTKGWNAPLATFWMQRGGEATLNVGGCSLNGASAPQIVYALVQETNEDGKPVDGAEVKIYATEIDTDGIITLTIPDGYLKGCTVALVQPKADYGSVVITGPAEIKENKSAESYDVPYTATYTMSRNLQAVIEQSKDLINDRNCIFQFVVKLDSRLIAKTGEEDYQFTSPIFDIAKIETGSGGSTVTVTCKLKNDWEDHIDELVTSPMVLTGVGKLDAKAFSVGDILNITGNIQVQSSNQRIFIPANVSQTKMVGLIQHMVTFDPNGGKLAEGTDSSVMVSDGDPVAEPADPSRSNYTFEGWYLGNTPYNFSSAVTEDITLTAHWQKKGSSGTNYYTLTYESNGGTAYKAEQYKPGTVVTLDKQPLREGYTFTGWYADKDCSSQISSIKMDSSKTVYAGWKKTETPEILNGDNHFAYVIGYQDGMVHPAANITRAEVATIFFRLLKEDVRNANMTKSNSFSDVASGDWYNAAISTMVKLGIVKGYEDGTFRPNEPISRAEFAAIAARFDKRAADSTANFSDIFNHWAAVEISKATENGWINGYTDGTFKPDRNIVRSEAMALINRVLNRNPGTPDDLLKDMILWPDNMDTGKWYYLDVQEATNSHDYERKADYTEKWTKITEAPDWAALEK